MSEEPTVRRTHRWRGAVAVALAAGAAGLLSARPTLLLVAVVAVCFAAYPRVSSIATVDVSAERTVADADPAAGDEVEVTVTVRNDGRWPLVDARFVDGVPPMLEVVDGSPRHGALLWPGAETSFSYAVRAARGTHRFDPVTLLARDASGGTEVEARVDPSGEHELVCESPVPEVPLREVGRGAAGDLVTDQAGSGVEFYHTREYRRGDPVNRIDWRRYARTGDLSTVEFRAERSAAVVLLVDARAPSYVAAEEGEPHAVAHAVGAADGLADSLASTPHHVGLAAVGRERSWLSPGSGDSHHTRLRRRLTGDAAFSLRPPAEPRGEEAAAEQLRAIRGRIDAGTQVVFLSPLVDGFAVEVAHALAADGNAVTVVSPDVTADDTVGERLAALERRSRVDTLRESSVRVVDWDPAEPLGISVARAQEAWA